MAGMYLHSTECQHQILVFRLAFLLLHCTQGREESSALAGCGRGAERTASPARRPSRAGPRSCSSVAGWHPAHCPLAGARSSRRSSGLPCRSRRRFLALSPCRRVVWLYLEIKGEQVPGALEERLWRAEVLNPATGGGRRGRERSSQQQRDREWKGEEGRDRGRPSSKVSSVSALVWFGAVWERKGEKMN